jgi:cytochrome c oxidase accessory protein FixG
VSATSDASSSLYAAAQKVYAREVSGRFDRLRVSAACALLGLFYGLPWLQWDGHQAILFDLPARKFHIFGLMFFPQDFFFLTWLLIIAAVSLFFFTALAGRLWCGYACPQTVWTSAFLAIERWCEGNRLQRMKLDRAPWSARKLVRKGGKQALWILFAAYTGLSFVGYFPVSSRRR